MKPSCLYPFHPTLIKKYGSALLVAMLSANSFAQSGPIYGGLEQQIIINQYVHNTQKTGTNTSSDASLTYRNGEHDASNFSSIITGNSTVHNELYGGSSEVVLRAGEAIAGNATANGSNNLNKSAIAYAHAYATSLDTNITSNKNTAQVTENGSVFSDVYGGNASLELYSAKSTAGTAIAAGADSSATAHAYSYATISNTVVQSSENTVQTVHNATINGNITAGKAKLYAHTQPAYGGDTNGETTSSFAHAHAVASNSTVSADRNQVKVDGNTRVTGDILGGHASITLLSSSSKAGNAISGINSNSTANVHAASHKNIISSSHNQIDLDKNVQVKGNIYGGYAALIASAGAGTSGTVNGDSDKPYAFVVARDTKLYANENTITFNNNHLNQGSLYGGYVKFELNPGLTYRPDGKAGDRHIDNSDSIAQAINNTINVGDFAKTLDSSTSIYGGYLEANPSAYPNSYDMFSGNTLNFSAKPLALNQLANIEHYNFTIEPSLANSQTSLISAKDVVLGTDSSNNNIADDTSKVKVVGMHSGQILNTGDKFYLIRAENSMSGFGGEGAITQVQQGISLLYDVQTEIDQTQGVVTAKILGNTNSSGNNTGNNSGNNSSGNAGNNHGTGSHANDKNHWGVGSAVKVNPQLEALPSGQLAGALLISRGSDMIANNVIDSIQNQYNGFNLFAHGTGNHSRYASGTLKSEDMLLTGGISYHQDNISGAIFVETGHSNYDSAVRPAFSAKVHGDGQNRYYGAGLLGRYHFENGFYAEGSLRAGNSKNTYATKDILNRATGQYASYTLKGSYVSTHIGAGYVLPLSEKNELEISAKYMWTHLEGKDALVAGDQISFKPIDSQRIRLNANLTHQYSENMTLNAGLGYEHEFDAKAKATTYGIFDIQSPGIHGGTGIISFGGAYQSETYPGLSVDLKARGYVGKREGASLGVTFNYQF